MSCNASKNEEFGSDEFEHSAMSEAWHQVGGERTWKPFDGESNAEFKARMQIYSGRLRTMLVNAGMSFVVIRCKLHFVKSKYVLGMLAVHHQPEAVDFSASLMPIDIGMFMRQVDGHPVHHAA